ncbi:methyl-accepting chemotaxis protein [Halobacterium salinarum]|uniref:Methyl-accepting chemotaxis protein n=2 Tax=Halobacterium salinarum TaxID=2242 RepID=A0A841HBP7_HALSI|nr:methyl-accepting chemotaxis protein [Halobacterium salinarum]MBB6089964.1 methyl-accepting chemotaxis protein [Halobacterium salinarum]MDL0120680.1 methyl-accepting chemotaxis protein [Halobacterium salinarum]MDL0130557.1 methyl-accepting chemotaxis protein [Halobacterium salinarum]MDL0136785.1 methyl-accepting chemotaxis protein [Halobacterium salinarum]MDL0141879.1 methyl-accepting chemotaxis protein [Halobacterium salinarum]
MTLEDTLPDWVRRSYVRKFSVLAAVLIVSIVVTGVVTQTAVSNQLTDQQQATLLTNADQEAGSLEQWVQSQRSTVRTLSKHRGLTADSNAAVRQTLATEREFLPPEVAHLHYVGRQNGSIRASTDRQLEGAGIAATNIVWPQEQAFSDVSFETPDAVVQTWMYTDDGTPSVAYASPVPEEDALLIAVVRTSERAQRFTSAINGTKTTAVGDTTGDVLFDRNESAFLTQYQSIGGSGVIETIESQDRGTVVTEDTIIAFAAVQDDATNWVVVKETPKSDALAIANNVQTNIWVLLGLTLVGLVGFVAVVRAGLIGSLREITTQTAAIADGNLDQEIQDNGRIDEIGRVRSGFRDIKSYLQTVEGQAIALSQQDFDNDVLDDEVPGTLGESLTAMQTDLETFIEDLTDAREEAERSQRDAEQSREEAQALADSLERQAERFSTQMQQAADGDLTQRLDTDVDRESLAQIATAFNDMLVQLEALVDRIQATANAVDDRTHAMSASTDEIEQSSMSVAKSIEQISAGAENQNEKLTAAAGEMTDLSATVEEIASSSNNVAQQAEDAAAMGQDGQAAATDAIAEMDAIESKATQTVEEMQSLQEEVGRISDIVTMIDDIASQTDMLAINASIEAENASTSGDGFAVVADEVKSLAEDTATATDEVESLIAEVEASTSALAEDMYEMRDRVGDGQDTITDTAALLEDIVDRVEDANAGIQSINDATEDQAASVQEATRMVEEVASVSDQTAGEASNVSAAAEEQTSAIQEISQSAQSLQTQATELLDRAEQFDTS